MRTALTALTIGLTTLGMAAPAFAQLPVPRIHVQVGTPTPPPVYVQPAPVQPVPQPPQYGYGYGGNYDNGYRRGYYRGGGPRWQDPQFFSMRVRDQVDRIRQDIRTDVQQGVVSPAVWGAMRDGRDRIEGNLRAASMDGVITFDERQNIMGDVDQLRRLDAQFRVRGPYGGGPWNRPTGGGWR